MAKEKKNGSMVVLDGETDKMVEISKDRQRYAAAIHSHILVGSIISAIGIKKMKDEKLYLGMNCSTFEEYIDLHSGMGRTTAYNYLKVASKLASVENLIPENLDENSEMPEVTKVGFSKLIELTKMDDANFEELALTGSTKINDAELRLEEIREQSAREVSKAISNTKKKYTADLSEARETVKQLEAEKKLLKTEIEQNQTKVKSAEILADQFGSKAANYEQKFRMLTEAENYLEHFNRLMNNAQLNEDDTEDIRLKYQTLVKRTHEYHTLLADNNAEYFED